MAATGVLQVPAADDHGHTGRLLTVLPHAQVMVVTSCPGGLIQANAQRFPVYIGDSTPVPAGLA